MNEELKFDFGRFKYNKITINSAPLIKGRFTLNIIPQFPREFRKTFWFYDLEFKLKADDIISLGPYYPSTAFNSDSIFRSNLIYPAFSDIALSSKSGPLHKDVITDFIRTSRIQQLRIISNFYAHYLKTLIGSLNYDELVPVPAKPKYSFN